MCHAVQSADTIMGLKLLMFIASSAIFACIILVFVKFYKLHGKFYKDMLSMLEVTREQRKLEEQSA